MAHLILGGAIAPRSSQEEDAKTNIKIHGDQYV